MSKSVDQIELAKSKIQSFEKNKNIDSLVSMIIPAFFCTVMETDLRTMLFYQKRLQTCSLKSRGFPMK